MYKKVFRFLKSNLKHICDLSAKIAGVLFSILTLLLAFVSWDDLGITKKSDRLLVLIIVIIMSIISALVFMFLKRSNVLWEQGDKKIKIIYGDILKIAFPKKDKGKKIVVIPVNTCFDTIVGHGIISENTIHGKWIKGIEKKGISIEKLDEEIANNINEQGLKQSGEYSAVQKSKGKRLWFPQGTVLSIKGELGLTYFLLALSKFDENMNAQCSKEEFVSCIQSLIAFYDKNGQGSPIYLPLMGTGLSRVNISPEESLNILVNMLKLNRDKVHGIVNVVVFNKQSNEVSIHNI